MDTLLTKRDVCRVLGISNSTLGRLLREGAIEFTTASPATATKLKRKRFTEESIRKFLKNGAVKSG